jgi:catechol 2,3-dioxygenase-like lactoylglutathione lyase family enzyme
MRIRLTNVFVDDQDKALRFYLEVLGFVKKRDFPVGRFKWLTVVSPEEPEGTELLLEPSDNPATKAFNDLPITIITFGVGKVSQQISNG